MIKKARSVRKRSTFRRRSNASHTESVIKRALKNNRLTGRVAQGGS